MDEIKEGIVEATRKDGEKLSIDADTVVIAVGSCSNDELFWELEGKLPELYMIGDCCEPSRILEAVREATYLAHKI